METTRPLTLFLADGHGIVREGIAAFCRSRPELTIVGGCGDGAEALEQILAVQPDVVVLECNLPSLNGLDLIEALRASGSAAALIVLSSTREEAVVQEAFRRGASGYVLKQGPAQHLFDAIEAFLKNRRYVTPLLRAIPEEGAGRDAEAPPSPADVTEQLSKRESEVFILLAEGMRPKDVAARLSLSPKTVDTYRANILRKLRLDGTAGLIRYAMGRKPS